MSAIQLAKAMGAEKDFRRWIINPKAGNWLRSLGRHRSMLVNAIRCRRSAGSPAAGASMFSLEFDRVASDDAASGAMPRGSGGGPP